MLLNLLLNLLVPAILLVGLLLLKRKHQPKDKIKTIILMIGGVLYLAVYFLRVFTSDVLNNEWVDGPGLAGIKDTDWWSTSTNLYAVIMKWIGYAIIPMLILFPFFYKKIPYLKKTTYFFVLPVLLVRVFSFNIYAQMFEGYGVINPYSYRSLQFIFENFVGLILVVLTISFNGLKGFIPTTLINKELDVKQKTKAFFKQFGLGTLYVLLMVLFCMPSNTVYNLYGNSQIVFTFFGTFHRIWLLVVVALIVVFYSVLKHKPKEIIYFVMCFLSLMVFLQFMYDDYSQFIGQDVVNPSVLENGLISTRSPFARYVILFIADLPIHLCNMATILIPIAIIFKKKRLFAFNVIVNVAGGIVGLVVANLPSGMDINSYRFYRYFYEHIFITVLPILSIMLGLFPRFDKSTAKKYLTNGLAIFAIYFFVVWLFNTWFTNYATWTNQEGLVIGELPDYFYINTDFVSTKIPFLRALRTENLRVIWNFGNGIKFDFYPLYQIVIFLGFSAFIVLIAFAYSFLFKYVDERNDISKAIQLEKLDYTEFKKTLKENNLEITDPINKLEGIMLKITNFSKTYSGAQKPAVKNFNLIVNDGEIFGFLGANGAGKSTTIKSLVGVLPFNEGSIEIDGFSISKQPLQAKRLIGYVPDNHAIYERLTGREYVNYIANLFGVSKKDRDEKLQDLLVKFNLVEAINNPIKSYSHGMKQKVTIMAALIHDPKLWVLDEPLTGLDPQSSFEVKEYMKEHASKGNVVFFSSHVIEVVAKICDRVAIINNGSLVGVYDLRTMREENVDLEAMFMELTSPVTNLEKKEENV